MPTEKWTAAEFREYLATGKAPDRDCVSVSAANVEPGFGDEFKGTDAVEAEDKRVSISIFSRHKRQPDTDGICAKYLIDAIVDAGILRDDSPRFVGKVCYIPEKLEKGEGEKTILIIEEI